ncbi:MAG: phosphoglucosamine mutase [Parcubacteria group bacterium]
MPIKASISGIRGTIDDSDGLRPDIISQYVLAYGTWLLNSFDYQVSVILARDSRPSGKLINNIVKGTLNYLGIEVIDLGLVSTPTAEIAVTEFKAQGAIIITASHNPNNWNALKLLNEKGEFLNSSNMDEVLKIFKSKKFNKGANTKVLNKTVANFNNFHIKKILDLKVISKETISKANFKVVVDGINSVGGPAVLQLLKALGVNDIIELNCDCSGNFRHNPEPLADNLTELSSLVKKEKADLGLAVDPDGDRLAIVCEDGSFLGEEYTLVAVADYILSQFGPGNTVSNLSSSRALADITKKYNGNYFSAPVGEINVVEKMKEVGAIIGGEGSGGVIYPALHYGRDALVAVALFLNYLATLDKPCSFIKDYLPKYHLMKYKVDLKEGDKIEAVFKKIKAHFKEAKVNDLDGLKLDFENSWAHLRASNTEPIVRLYIEGKTKKECHDLYEKIINIIENK